MKGKVKHQNRSKADIKSKQQIKQSEKKKAYQQRPKANNKTKLTLIKLDEQSSERYRSATREADEMKSTSYIGAMLPSKSASRCQTLGTDLEALQAPNQQFQLQHKSICSGWAADELWTVLNYPLPYWDALVCISCQSRFGAENLHRTVTIWRSGSVQLVPKPRSINSGRSRGANWILYNKDVHKVPSCEHITLTLRERDLDRVKTMLLLHATDCVDRERPSQS
jgi:hypothetical protein